MLPLERPHRFCLKCMQNLPRNTKTEVVLNLLASKTIEEEIDRLKLMFLNSYVICQAIYLLKKFFIHRLVNYCNNPRRKVGFIPDMHRILEKNIHRHLLCKILSDMAVLLSKYSWKRLLTDKISSQCRNELLLKANDSASLTRFLIIHDSPEPYILYHVIRETPKLYNYGKLAIRLLGFLFSGDYTTRGKQKVRGLCQ